MTEGNAEGNTGGTPPWFDGFDTETKGYIQIKGLDKKTPAEAFLEVSKFHREAEKFVGAPANEMMRLPKDPNAPEWKNVWERLGKPVDAKDYDFTTVKRAGDKPLDQALADTLRKAAFDSNIPKEAAVRMAAELAKHFDSTEAASEAINADKFANEKRELEKNWGGNIAANTIVAQGAVRALGVDPQAVAALEKVEGYAKVMEMFRNIGSKIGEDRFVSNSSGSGKGPMTTEQAVAEKEALKRDEAWRNRYLKGGVEEKRQLDALDRIILGIR